MTLREGLTLMEMLIVLSIIALLMGLVIMKLGGISGAAAGFADGLLRGLGAGGYGWFAGKARPFLGRISIDLIALDMTDCKEARPGAMVELLAVVSCRLRSSRWSDGSRLWR